MTRTLQTNGLSVTRYAGPRVFDGVVLDGMDRVRVTVENELTGERVDIGIHQADALVCMLNELLGGGGQQW